jgi:hypothetical protein
VEVRVEQEERSESSIKQQPDKITPRHRLLMRLLVSGKILKDAAAEAGFSLARASVIVTSPLFKDELKRMEAGVAQEFVEAEGQKTVDDTRHELMESRVVAAKTLRGALDDGDKKIALSAAKDILDRTGYAKEDKLQGKITVEPSQSLIDLIGRIGRDKDAGTDDNK